MWLKASNIACTHGFSTRHQGFSPPPFDSLNLGGSQDLQSNINQNRKSALKQLNISEKNVCTLKQIHSAKVHLANTETQTGDALVTNKKDIALAISVADCYPILFYDPLNNIIGAAHAGWRGTCANIAGNTIEAMLNLGAAPNKIQVAIGMGISQKNFEVGEEVIQQFDTAGFPTTCWQNNKIDLVKCNEWLLMKHNIPAQNIWKMNRCTFEDDFFSYRKDKGLTGRMWGIIAMP